MGRVFRKAMLVIALSGSGVGVAGASATERDAVEACTARLIEYIGERQGTPPDYEIAGRYNGREDFTRELLRPPAGTRNYRYTLEVAEKAGGPVLWKGECVVDRRARVRWVNISELAAVSG